MEDQFKNIMVDIETMGNKSNSAIISIAAVYFNIISGETGKHFYQTIDLQSCLNAGLQFDADTVIWWLNQSEEARKELNQNNAPDLYSVLFQLGEFIHPECEIWGNSARFDLGILQNAYDKVMLPLPWNHRKERCLRTIASLEPEIKKNWKFEGERHNALHDCYHQIAYLRAIYNTLKIPY